MECRRVFKDRPIHAFMPINHSDPMAAVTAIETPLEPLAEPVLKIRTLAVVKSPTQPCYCVDGKDHGVL
jgi:hypothetical protein